MWREKPTRINESLLGMPRLCFVDEYGSIGVKKKNDGDDDDSGNEQ